MGKFICKYVYFGYETGEPFTTLDMYRYLGCLFCTNLILKKENKLNR